MQKRQSGPPLMLALLGLILMVVWSIVAVNTAYHYLQGMRLGSATFFVYFLGLGLALFIANQYLWMFFAAGTGYLAGEWVYYHAPANLTWMAWFIGLGVGVLSIAAWGAYKSMPPGWPKMFLFEADEPVTPSKRKGNDTVVQKKTVSNNQEIVRKEGGAFDGLVGVEHAIEAIRDALELPIRYPDKVKKYGIKPGRGVLLYGPPGTGKTSLAKAAAKYFNCDFQVVNASELLRPYVGQAEMALKQVFARARENAPAIIFFDEIDAIGQRRDGQNLNRASDILLNQLLAEMDGFRENDGVFIMAATNRPDILDEALLRPGRFDQAIEVPLPNREARKKLFQVYLKGKPLGEEINWDLLAEKTEGLSPAYIAGICRQAAIRALKREAAVGKSGILMEDLVGQMAVDG